MGKQHRRISSDYAPSAWIHRGDGIEMVESGGNDLRSTKHITVVSKSDRYDKPTTQRETLKIEKTSAEYQETIATLRRQRCGLVLLALLCCLVVLVLGLLCWDLTRRPESYNVVSGLDRDHGGGCKDDSGSSGSSSSNVAGPQFFCGCSACTDVIWHSPGAGFPGYSCGDRVERLLKLHPFEFPTEMDACRQVAFEYPCECGKCDPARCNLQKEPFVVPSDWKSRHFHKSHHHDHYDHGHGERKSSGLYCFPEEMDRIRYNIWDGMIAEVKTNPYGDGKCGPVQNMFDAHNVEVVNEQELILRFAHGNASEVRLLLPEAQRPFSYGKYEFFVKSIQIRNEKGRVLSRGVLPKELVLGMFTWNPFANDDDEDSHETNNWNHEVDIELSRWNCPDNADAQFVVQPPGFPQMSRFFTGPNATVDQDKQYYRFNWLPSRVHFFSTAGGTAGQDFTVSTAELLYKGKHDLIQCLPNQNVEVRINLWNVLGARHPNGLPPNAIVQVVIGHFKYYPSQQTHLMDGSICSRDCQCRGAAAGTRRSKCIDNRCATASGS